MQKSLPAKSSPSWAMLGKSWSKAASSSRKERPMSEQLLLLSVGPSGVVPAWVLLQQPTALFSWSLGSRGAPKCSAAA